MHHTIVALEGMHIAIPEFSVPSPHTGNQTVHHNTSPDQVAERIKDATILITTTVKLTAALLEPLVTPKLQLVSQLGTGYDNIDIEACRKRGITVCNTPGGNTDTVAEHAIALFFAIRRNVALMHTRAMAGEWKEKGSITKYMRDGNKKPPITLREEVCGVVGYGKIGKRVAQLMKGMGVKIVIADRKAAISQTDEPEFVEDDLESPKRTSFKSVLRNCTSIVLTCPLTPETKNLISEAELVAMRPDAIVVNVARGGVVDEAAIAKALNQERISGYATDVFSKEPASSEDNPLLRDLKDDAHFLASPHVAWFSETTIVNLSKILKDNVELWLAGTPQNVIV